MEFSTSYSSVIAEQQYSSKKAFNDASIQCLSPQPSAVYICSKTSFEKNCFSAWASTLNMGLINKVDPAPTKG